MKKIKIEIKNRWTGSIIFEYEKENNTLKETIKEYIRQEVEEKEKYRADLTDANLTRADLTDANLTRANLTDANLTDANLTRVDLTDANLTRANLTRADLTDANLTDANLTRANLTDANLTRADLTRVDLTDANLTRANLTVIKNDLFIVLLHGITEIKFLKQNIIDGKIDGSTYEGECACLSGTLVNGAKITDGKQEEKVIQRILDCRDSGRPIERFFMNIKTGDTPETNQCSKLALQWVEEFELLTTPFNPSKT